MNKPFMVCRLAKNGDVVTMTQNPDGTGKILLVTAKYVVTKARVLNRADFTNWLAFFTESCGFKGTSCAAFTQGGECVHAAVYA